RRWGIARELRAATPLPAEYSTEIAFVTSVVGREITRFANVFFSSPDGDERFAEPAQQVPQYVLEPVLHAHAERLGSVTFRDGWRVEDVVQRDDGVELQARHGDDTRIIRGRFAVGCDGAASTVRRCLDIELTGRRAIARNYGVVFRAPELAGLIPFAPALHFW